MPTNISKHVVNRLFLFYYKRQTPSQNLGLKLFF